MIESDEDTGIDINLKYESLDKAIQSIEQFLGVFNRWMGKF